MRKKFILKILIGAFFVSLILLSTRLLYPNPSIAPNSPVPTPMTYQPANSPIHKGILVKVARVIDGDTIEIETGQRVRYIGVDAPETVHPKKLVQCFGKEASNKNRELVDGQTVELERDVSETDKYGRLLRYVWVEDLLINEYLVEEGFASAVSYPPDIKYQERFLEAQRLAKEEKKGLWGNVCLNE